MALIFFMKKNTITFCLLGGLLLVASCATPRMRPEWFDGLSRRIGQAEYVPLVNLCDIFRIAYEWDPLTGKHILYKDGVYLSFRPGERVIHVDGESRELPHPPLLAGGALLFPRELAELRWWERRESLWQELKTLYPPATFVIDKVVIDPGHGGKDRGTGGAFGILEKRINLEIARRLAGKLNDLGIETILTREDDTYLTLPERAWRANSSGADLFVSIHANAARDPRVSGAEIFYVSEKSDRSEMDPRVIDRANPLLSDLHSAANCRKSRELARAIGASLERFRRYDYRGIKGAEFFVLKWTDKPAVLIETGFLSNRIEARRLADAAYQDYLAGRIAEGILAYKAEYEQTRGFAS